MIREQTIRAHQKLVGKLPVPGELLRGTLLDVCDHVFGERARSVHSPSR
jgi:hypothetical protein